MRSPNQIRGNYFFLENYVTLEGAVTHNVLYYTNLSSLLVTKCGFMIMIIYPLPTYRTWFGPVVSGRVWGHLAACSVFLWPVYPAMGDRAFSNISPRLWNSLPQHLKDTHDISRFQHSLKTHLFRLAYQDIEWTFLLVLDQRLWMLRQRVPEAGWNVTECPVPIAG